MKMGRIQSIVVVGLYIKYLAKTNFDVRFTISYEISLVFHWRGNIYSNRLNTYSLFHRLRTQVINDTIYQGI